MSTTDEALRYMGAWRGAGKELRQRTAETLGRLEAELSPRHCLRAFPLLRRGESFLLDGAGLELSGQSAAALLSDCESAALLCCTLGAPFDGRLREAQARDMSEAVILDACGSAYIESVCDRAERELAELFPGKYLTDRFSPGYGDLPLTLQPAILAALDAERRVGVHVTESLLLNPLKSVTAVIGIASRPRPALVRGCAYCPMRENCALRKEGEYCGL